MKLNALEKIERVILIVDDEPSILKFVSLILTTSGFKILVAESGEEALRISREYEGRIHLMLTNVQMKGMTGLELGTKISLERPDLKVMMMSGFTAGMLVLDGGWHFLHKPFIPA